jgi:hypothetical protein
MSSVATIAAVGSIGGALVSANGAKKNAPQAAPYTPVDLQAQQSAAVNGNLANQSSIDQLLAQSNQFQQTQATQLMNQAVPGYTGLASALTNRATSLANNPYALPQDVQDMLTQQAAQQGVSLGTRGQFNQFDALKDLGVNALQYGQSNLQTAMQALQTVSGTAPKVSPMSPLSFYVSPQQNAANQQFTNTQQQQIAQGSNNANAAALNFNSQNLWDSLNSSLGQNGGVGGMLNGILNGGGANSQTSGGTGQFGLQYTPGGAGLSTFGGSG